MLLPEPLQLPCGRTLAFDRPLMMGILNITPDSFSDGGRHAALENAITHGLILASEGADIIDIGGESTRPGSQRVDAAEQQRRIIEVVRQLRIQFNAMGPTGHRVAISVDTTLSPVAAAALDAGADILNDISAGLDDPAMLTLAAARKVPIVLMHMQGQPATMQQNPTYDDVVSEVIAHLRSRIAAAAAAGIHASQIIVDPGIGFGKTRDHNLALLASLDRFVALGHPVLLGTSRKRFMGTLCADPDGTPPSPRDLLGATCATTALGVAKGVQMFRVHDVRPNRQAAEVSRAMVGH